MNVTAISKPFLASAALDHAAPSARAKPISMSAVKMAGPEEQRRAVGAQFEAILVRQMLSKTVSSMLGSEDSGPAAGVYGDMLTDTFAQQLTAGPGLGLGRLLERQLSPRGVPAVAPEISSQ